MMKTTQFAFARSLAGAALALTTGFAAPADSVPAATAPSASVFIDATKVTGPTNRLIFGHNIEAADNKGIFEPVTDRDLLLTAMGHWDLAKAAPVPAVVTHARALGMSALRYPGGCLTHNYDWRMAVGPRETRGDWQFGLDEYIALCRAIGAEPMMTVSVYVLPAEEIPAHAAGLVEYLNAPATPAHPWAMKRKAAGHPEPYGVKWFELGNEEDHGNHDVTPRRKFTPRQYAKCAVATAAAMRKVDASIKIGIITVPGDSTNVYCDWNRTVLKESGAAADFVVVHAYSPNSPKLLKKGQEALMMRACMAVGDQVEHALGQYRALIKETCGRELPLAITEFNSLAPDRLEGAEAELLPYRFTYGAALEAADLLRIFLKPENQVLTANYWQYYNGYFGLLRNNEPNAGPDGFTKKPMYHLYHLWTQHLGEKLLDVTVAGPRASFDGLAMTAVARGDAYVPGRSVGVVDALAKADLAAFKKLGMEAQLTADGLAIELKNFSGKEYPIIVPALAPDMAKRAAHDYDISFEGRFIPAAGSGFAPLGLRIVDASGLDKTAAGQQESLASISTAINGIASPEWEQFRTRFQGIVNSTGIQIQAQLESLDRPVSGRMEIRKLRLEAFTPASFPAYSLLTTTASISADGKTLYLIVFNKSDQQDISAEINLRNFGAKSAKVWTVNGPDLLAKVGVNETVSTPPSAAIGAGWKHVFPAHSMTAIEFYR